MGAATKPVANSSIRLFTINTTEAVPRHAKMPADDTKSGPSETIEPRIIQRLSSCPLRFKDLRCEQWRNCPKPNARDV